MKKPDLFCMRPVERINRLGGGLQQNLAALFSEISLGFRREMHIAHLARTENELLASPLEDELRFVFREHVRGAVVLLRQLLLPLHHLAREANDHVVLIGAPRKIAPPRQTPKISPRMFPFRSLPVSFTFTPER